MSAVVRFFDPKGERFGIPTWPWRLCPEGLATRDQLKAQGKQPGTQPVAGQIKWHSKKARHCGGVRHAYLFRIDLAVEIGAITPGRAKGLEAAMRSRRTCKTCGTERDYCISTKLGECTDCADGITSLAA